VDKRSNYFHQGLRHAAPAQQDALSQQLICIFRGSEYLATAPMSPPASQPAEGSFFEIVKRMTLYGYYTSEVALPRNCARKLFPAHITAVRR